MWLGIDVGSDIALANAMARVIIHAGLANDEFIERATTGYEEFARCVEAYTLEVAEKETGVPAYAIRDVALEYGRADKAMICWTLGITEHHNATDNVLALINLALLTGKVGRYGCGLNPLRGQNNVQGGARPLPPPVSAENAVIVPDQRLHDCPTSTSSSRRRASMITRCGPPTRLSDARSRAELACPAPPLRHREGRRDPMLRHEVAVLRRTNTLPTGDLALTARRGRPIRPYRASSTPATRSRTRRQARVRSVAADEVPVVRRARRARLYRPRRPPRQDPPRHRRDGTADDPIARAELRRMEAADEEWARLLGHLAETGPSELEDLQLELGLKAKELKLLRRRSSAAARSSRAASSRGAAPAERAGALGPALPRAGRRRRDRRPGRRGGASRRRCAGPRGAALVLLAAGTGRLDPGGRAPRPMWTARHFSGNGFRRAPATPATVTQTGVTEYALRIAVAAVGPAHAGEDSGRPRRRLLAGGDEGLDRPGRRLAVRGAAPTRAKPPSLALEPAR